MTSNNLTARRNRTYQQSFNSAIELNQPLKFKQTASQNKGEISNTLSWHQSRIQKLEQDKIKLSKHIEECYDYIEHQSDNARRLKAKLQKMNTRTDDVLNNKEWVSVPRSLIHKAMIFGLILYALGVWLSTF